MPIRNFTFQKNQHYHITNRGIKKKKIFYNKDDYMWFINRINHFKTKYKIDIICYCLMPNHFHLIIRPNKTHGIIKFLSYLQASHSRHFNSKWNRKGQLFEGRYYPKLIEDQKHLIHTINYVINNPVKAKLVSKPEEWPYLSFNLPYIKINPD
ncbi:transposase [Candidatus Peregrinibacteria bacterium]|jgi:putative transposase|nr:transposase [Candidatus Peregrinibacteria bacterium]MBT4148529.1 transposase [Candidatus Peregrinibacteria bacterium]MBT4455542.1 transposase [Candidatus Peregrinibacteria bacterium]